MRQSGADHGKVVLVLYGFIAGMMELPDVGVRRWLVPSPINK
jgi:hypothetical protein